MIVPVLAGLMGGARIAITYSVLAVLSLGMVAVVDLLGMSPPVPLANPYVYYFDLLQTGVVTTVILSLVRVFVHAQRVAERRLVEAK